MFERNWELFVVLGLFATAGVGAVYRFFRGRKEELGSVRQPDGSYRKIYGRHGRDDDSNPVV